MVNPQTPRHVAVIRHMAFEDTGIFGEVLTQRGWTVATLEAGIDDLAALREADLAVVLGGPIGVYETDRYPFLNAERAGPEKRLAAGRPTLGICLGAQLIAQALGARVYPGGKQGNRLERLAPDRSRRALLPRRAWGRSRCCTGTATPSTCRQGAQLAGQHRRVREPGLLRGHATSWRCNSTPRRTAAASSNG
jgi:hypothetical protein